MDLSETDLGRKSILLAVFAWMVLLPASILVYAIFFIFPGPFFFYLANLGVVASLPSLLLWRKTVLKPYLRRNAIQNKEL